MVPSGAMTAALLPAVRILLVAQTLSNWLMHGQCLTNFSQSQAVFGNAAFSWFLIICNAYGIMQDMGMSQDTGPSHCTELVLNMTHKDGNSPYIGAATSALKRNGLATTCDWLPRATAKW